MATRASIRTRLAGAVDAAIAHLYDTGALEGERPGPTVLQPPKQAEHGDFACTTALGLARTARKNPRQIATLLQDALGDAGGMLERTEIAGPGFLNLFVNATTWREALGEILAAGGRSFRSEAGGGHRVLVEFVSANPTGPMHIGHGRGAVTGDLIARLLDAAGYQVDREYYINDLGNQVDVLASSIHLRYRELFGHAFEPPEDFYPGDYVRDIAVELRDRHGGAFVDAPRETWLDPIRRFGVDAMMKRIRADLEAFGITFDNFVSEREVTEAAGMRATLDKLQERGVIYEKDGKRWFRSTDFGDDKDRVVEREDGTTTYFASDIAYHDHKLQRGYQTLINVWGADHGGYIARVKAGIAALGWEGDPLEVILVQIVSISRGGQAVRMGKRLGTAVWLSDILQEVGRDACRYFFAMRRAESQMDFDIELATQKTLDNPVFYAQMGHARLCSIARRAREAGVPDPIAGPGAFDALTLPEEIRLIQLMDQAPDRIAQAAAEREPHQVVHYIQELIAQFHSYYTLYGKTEKVISPDPDKTRARLLMCQALRELLGAVLTEILGVSAPEEMYLEGGGEGADAEEEGA